MANSSEENNERFSEIKHLVNLVQNFAEINKYAFLVSEMMLLVLTEDDKCRKCMLSVAAAEEKSNLMNGIHNDLLEYINENVERTKSSDGIHETPAYVRLIQASISAGAMRGIEPDSLCAFQMVFADRDSACAAILSKYGIYEENVIKYITEYRKQKISDHTKHEFLEQFAINLTSLAKDGKIDPLIGREKEVRRVIQILSKRKSCCPILLGNPGTGKSAIVEGLALKIAEGNDLPKSLIGKEIYAIDLTGMLAGTKYRGEFEARLEGVIKELAADENSIAFLDEMHMIVGAGSSEGAMDCSNILKPYLSRGQIRVIGATTYDEYKNKIEKDKAFCRRFKKVDVPESSPEDTVKILRGLSKKYEEFHGVKFPDEVLEKAVSLSGRYLLQKFFPDKAIDVIDEVGARYRSGLKDGDTVTVSDVEEVVCEMANIPKITVEEDGKEMLQNLGENIKKELFGQDETVDKIVRQIRMERAGLKNRNKPLGFLELGPTGCGKTELARVLAKELKIGFTKLDMSEYREEYSVSKLIGSSAGYVGYEQAGALTEPLIKNPHQIVLLDEIEKANASVYNLLLQVLDDGRLTDNHGREASFRNAIVIMTSNVGFADAEQMSRSMGFDSDDEKHQERQRKAVEDAFRKRFSPEFRNRLTDVFYFNPLNEQTMAMIVDKSIRRIQDAVSEKKIEIAVSDEAKEWFVKKAMEENCGGRPVERLVDSEVSERLASEILFGKFSDGNGGKVSVDFKNEKIELLFS